MITKIALVAIILWGLFLLYCCMSKNYWRNELGPILLPIVIFLVGAIVVMACTILYTIVLYGGVIL